MRFKHNHQVSSSDILKVKLQLLDPAKSKTMEFQRLKSEVICKVYESFNLILIVGNFKSDRVNLDQFLPGSA